MRPYVDRRVDDHVGASEAAVQASKQWGLVAPELVRHGMNAIFRCGDVVLRVATPSAPAEVSLELAALLRSRGIAVPDAVRSAPLVLGAFSVTAWEHVVADGREIDWKAVGTVVRAVHQLDVGDLPGGLPTPSPLDFPWWHHEQLLDEVDALIDPPAKRGLEAAIERHVGWREFAPSDCVVCHGDVHPGNVIMSASGPVLLDWDLLCVAPRGWDHAPMMTWAERWGGSPGQYADFALGSEWSAHGDRYGDAFAELRLVSATLMRLRVARSHPAAMPEAQRRLAVWRGDPDAPAWQAQ
ncbi:MAG: phosphotransferase [Ilumatobacter sp.]